MSLDLEVAGNTYRIETHGNGAVSGPHFAAVNVKYYGPSVKLSKRYSRKLERLVELGRVDRDEFDSMVGQCVQEWWWEWAVDRAKELDLGPAYSAGRSSGWLILSDWPPHRLLQLEGSPECQYCDAAFSDHANRKCLYEPTWYKPVEEADTEQIERIVNFFKECRDSVDQLYPALVHEYKFRIDEAWSDYTTERKETQRERVLGARRARVSARKRPDNISAATGKVP
jgi:hypothetical protein